MLVSAGATQSLLNMMMSASMLVFIEHSAHGLDRLSNAPRRLSVGALQCARARHGGVKFARKPCPVVAECFYLRRQGLFVAGSLAPAFGGFLQRVQRLRKAPARSLNRISLAHARIRMPQQ
jgi:hypothetical protein